MTDSLLLPDGGVRHVEDANGHLPSDLELPYLGFTPRRTLINAVEDFDGRCAWAYPGNAGQCTNDAEYIGHIQGRSTFQYVPVCDKHLEESVSEERYEQIQKLIEEGLV